MKRSKFNLTHTHSTTADAGQLIPFLLQPTLPGDRFRIGLKNFIRCQPMVAPLMHEVYFYTQYWYVPYRILWDNWEDFITGGDNLQASPAFPYVTAPSGGWQPGSLADYFGFPVKQAGIEVSAMPFRAYAEIWNTRYRDEDLQTDVGIVYTDGKDTKTNTDILSPSWKRDYFTLARPWTQRGSDILVPVTDGGHGAQIIHRHTISYRVGLFISDMYKLNINDDPDTIDFTTADMYFNGASFEYTGDASSSVTKTYNASTSTPAEKLAFISDLRGYFSRGVGSHKDALWTGSVPYANLEDAIRDFSSTSPNEIPVPAGSEITLTRKGPFNTATESLVLTNWRFSLYGYISNDETVPSVGVSDSFSGASAFDNPGGSNMWVRFTGSTDCNYGEGSSPLCSYVTYATLSQSGAVSVRDLRASSALQRYAERSLKFGNRYEEFIQREFGVKPRDSRIQRPEYLGGGRGILNISEVLQTAEGTDTSVGTMRGHGIASVSQRPIRFKSPEHGIIIGLLSIRPKAVYTQGIEREFLKRSRLDFFTPELANIGMQEVLTQELFATSTNKDSIFGYSDRYQEYRYHKPLVTGEFRDTLNYWNMARIFDNAPNLNDEFINMEYSSEVFKRPFAVQDHSYHSFLIMLENVIHAWRPIPKRAKDVLK